MARAGDIKIHGRAGYKHAPDGKWLFAVGTNGNLHRMRSTGWDYGMVTHNDAMRRLRDKYGDSPMVRCTLMPDGELQVFPISYYEPHSGTTKENEGYISKAAARTVINKIVREFKVNRMFFQFYNTGTYNGDVEGGVDLFMQVRYKNGNGRYPVKEDL